MSLIKISFVILLLFSFINNSKSIDYYSPENILKFADHLYSEKDFQRAAVEYERYISLEPSASEEILYKLGLCYRNSGDTNKAIKYFQKIETNFPNTNIKPAIYYQIAYTHIISGNYNESIKYIDESINKLKNRDDITKLQLLKSLCYLKQKRWHNAKKLLSSMELPTDNSNFVYIWRSLIRSAQEGIAIKRKSPIFGGILSSIMPGSGKVYCGQYGDGIFSFMLNTVTGVLAYDAFRDDNIRSIKGWLFSGIGVIFYLGNVYGSYISAKVYNNQKEMEILRNLPELPDDW